MFDLLILGVASCLFMGVKSFQTRNVADHHYKAMIPTALLISLVEVFIIVKLVNSGLSSFPVPQVLALGLGGGIGAMIATRIHLKVYHV